MPLEHRYQMVREFFKDDPLVAVYCLSDDEMGITGKEEWGIWLEHCMNDIVLNNCGVSDLTVDELKKQLVFYIGEASYKQKLEENEFNAVLVDRKIIPISGTMIRSNPIKYWDWIAWTYRRVFSHNILITGTASEGKTTLVEDIGRYFNMPYSYEWAREYMKQYCIGDWELDGRDFLLFLDGQYNCNRACIESKLNRGIFISDTDGIVTKMYAKYYALDDNMALTMEEFKNIIEPVADLFTKKSKWDKVFVVVPHGEFIDDHTRYMRHGDIESRAELLSILMEELGKAGLDSKITVLNGTYMSNFNAVKSYIERIENQRNE